MTTTGPLSVSRAFEEMTKESEQAAMQKKDNSPATDRWTNGEQLTRRTNQQRRP